MVKVNTVESYKEYGKCVSISNGVIEAYVTVDLGPRIIKFGYVDGQNIMCDTRSDFVPNQTAEYEAFYGKGRSWENFGGHRIWVTPERYPQTYTPDDRPVKYEVDGNSVTFICLDDCEAGIAKTLTLNMDPDDANMTVKMDVKNISGADKEFSVWAITVCAPDSTLIIPMNTNDTGYLHNRNISVWPYTDLRDERIYFGKKYATVKQERSATTPVKLGFDLNQGTAYLVMGEDIFIKRYKANHQKAVYPDGNCSFETYTNDVMIEVESLSEVKNVANGGVHSYTEFWSLIKKPCDVDFKNDDSIDSLISKM